MNTIISTLEEENKKQTKLIHIFTEEIPLTWLDFRVDKKTIFICVFLSLL